MMFDLLLIALNTHFEFYRFSPSDVTVNALMEMSP